MIKSFVKLLICLVILFSMVVFNYYIQKQNLFTIEELDRMVEIEMIETHKAIYSNK